MKKHKTLYDYYKPNMTDEEIKYIMLVNFLSTVIVPLGNSLIKELEAMCVDVKE